MSDTSNADNVVQFKKRRRALTNRAALQFLRESGDENGVIRVDAIADLSRMLAWEKTRTWKAVQRWTKDGRMETETDPDTGHIRIRVLPDRRDKERDKSTGQSSARKRGQRRGKSQLDGLDKVSNSVAASDTYQSTIANDAASQKMPLSTQLSPLQNAPSEREMSTPKIRFWRQRRRGNGDGNFPVGDSQPLTVIDRSAWLVAILLAGVAACFSVKGMVVLFPGAPTGSVIMGSAMELAKLVIAGWLGGRLNIFSWLSRFALVLLLVGLMSINAVGLYSQLVAAHIGHHADLVASNEAKDASIAAQIEAAEGRVANKKQRLAQINETIQAATSKAKSAKSAEAVLRQYQKEQAALAADLENAEQKLAALKSERATGAARGHAAETEAAPIQYVAQLLGIRAGGEEVIRWMIALMVLCCDPCAVIMMFTFHRLRRGRTA